MRDKEVKRREGERHRGEKERDKEVESGFSQQTNLKDGSPQ